MCSQELAGIVTTVNVLYKFGEDILVFIVVTVRKPSFSFT